MSKFSLTELNGFYRDAESADSKLFAEMRSNILLVAGDHYSKRMSNATANIRDPRVAAAEQKLRITKNHTHKVHRRYVSSILTYAGDVSVGPQDENEIQDRKDADLNKAVITDVKNKMKFRARRRTWANDFCAVGEVGVIVRWNPDKGELRGYEQKIGDYGDPMFDEMGQPVPDETLPVFKGEFEHEDLYGFNIWRDPGAKTMEESWFIGVKKLADSKKLSARYPDLASKISKTSDDSDYIVFDSQAGNYSRSKNKTLVKEIYIRPCKEFPKGYFYIFTTGTILEQGELPFGIWPIAWAGCDEFTSDPRGHSPIKQGRAYQAEINRSASSTALAQVTLGSDKVIYQTGTKLAPGALLPGVRGITYSGFAPQIIPGRDGSQYVPYNKDTIAEYYDVMDVASINMEKDDKGGYDAYSLLYKSASQKQAMSLYSEKFEQFLLDWAWIVLELAKKYLPDDTLIMAAGRKEIVNIQEFRKTIPLHYQIKLEAQDETIETKFGRQLTMQHILQYTGQNLEREDIGLLVRNMPFANIKHPFRGMTVQYDAIENEILAIERGETPQVAEGMDHDQAIKILTNRVNEPDFKYLPPNVRQMFDTKKNEHMQHKAQQEQALIDAKNEYIPVDGPMIAADVYVQDPVNPEKAPKRARIPQRAVEWLLQKLEAQGASLDKLESMNGGAMSQLASMLGMGGQDLGPSQALGLPGGPAMPQMFGG